MLSFASPSVFPFQLLAVAIKLEESYQVANNKGEDIRIAIIQTRSESRIIGWPGKIGYKESEKKKQYLPK